MGIVNSEGEVPSDLAEEPAMKDLLLEQVKKQGELRARGQEFELEMERVSLQFPGGAFQFGCNLLY